MKSSKAQITAKFYKVPTLRFEDQQLTPFSGLLTFQLLFKRLELKNSIEKMFCTFEGVIHFWPPFDCHVAYYSPAYIA